VNVNNLDFRGFGIDAFHRVGVIANNVGLAEQREGAGEEIVKIRRYDQSSQAFLAEQVSETEVRVRNGLASNQLLEIALALDGVREGPFEPVRVCIQR
jgi:hypothetical protein